MSYESKPFAELNLSTAEGFRMTEFAMLNTAKHPLFITPLLQRSSPKSLHIKENRLVFSLEPDIKTVNRFVVVHSGHRNQSLTAFLVLD